MTTECFTVWHDVLTATNDDWIAEKCRILIILQKSKDDPKNAAHTHTLGEMQKLLIDAGDPNDRNLTIEQYFDELAFCYPKLRQPAEQTKFIPATEEALAHLYPEEIADLTQLRCPYCQQNLGAVSCSKEFDIHAAGCHRCNKLFTPNEIIQIRELQKLQAN